MGAEYVAIGIIGFGIGFMACWAIDLGAIRRSFDDGFRLGLAMKDFPEWFERNIGEWGEGD